MTPATLSDRDGLDAGAPFGTGSQAKPGAADASPPSVSIPSAGEWLVIRDWGMSIRQIVSVTPKMFKLGAGTTRYPKHIGQGDRRIVAALPDREMAEKVQNGVGGIDGEYNKRSKTIIAERDARMKVATDKRNKAISRLIAKTIGGAA